MANMQHERQERGVSSSGQPWTAGKFDSSWLSALMARMRRTFLGSSVDRILSQIEDDGADPGTRFRLLRTAQLVMRSYNIALEASAFDFNLYLQSLNPELRGLAIEGGGMAFFVRDGLRPGGRCLRGFLEGPYADYALFTHVGCGLMMAKMRRSVAPYLRVTFDPVVSMVINGYGFGRTVFNRRLSLSEVPDLPRQLSEAERHIFDHGVGRALVFKLCGRIASVDEAISKVPAERQLDMWQGVGTAIAYNIGYEEGTRALRAWVSSATWAHVASGACMASWARAACGNRTEATDFAAQELVGQDIETQLAVVNSHAPDTASISPEQWSSWWEEVTEALRHMRPGTPTA